MSEIPSEKSERGIAVSALREASVLVRKVAEPRPIGDSVKAAINRASRRLGFHVSRTKDIWYENARRIHAEEIDALRREARIQRDETVARAEAVIAVARLVALRESLAATDSDFHRETVAALDAALRRMGCDVGAVAIRKG